MNKHTFAQKGEMVEQPTRRKSSNDRKVVVSQTGQSQPGTFYSLQQPGK